MILQNKKHEYLHDFANSKMFQRFSNVLQNQEL